MAEADDKQPKLPTFSKSLPITLHGGLLVSIIAVSWLLSSKVSQWERRMDILERGTNYRWSIQMEEDFWRDFKEKNPGVTLPDLQNIHARWNGLFK